MKQQYIVGRSTPFGMQFFGGFTQGDDINTTHKHEYAFVIGDKGGAEDIVVQCNDYFANHDTAETSTEWMILTAEEVE